MSVLVLKSDTIRKILRTTEKKKKIKNSDKKAKKKKADDYDEYLHGGDGDEQCEDKEFDSGVDTSDEFLIKKLNVQTHP